MKLSFSDSFGKMRLKLTNWEQFSLYFAQSSDVEFPDDRQASEFLTRISCLFTSIYLISRSKCLDLISSFLIAAFLTKKYLFIELFQD